MRQHFHRCVNLRVVAVDASQLSGERRGGSAILDELCDARKLARCVGLAECDILTPAQKRDLLGTRVTRMREEEGGASPLGEIDAERRQELLELARDLIAEREQIVADNRRLLAEAAGAEDRRERTATRSEQWEFGVAAISMRWDEDLHQLQIGRLDAIDRALEEIAGRGYGMCARCRGPIALERLRDAPDTHVCAKCAGESVPVA